MHCYEWLNINKFTLFFYLPDIFFQSQIIYEPQKMLVPSRRDA